MINHAIILAAGRGVRMLPLTKKIPKAMIKIKNETLILKGIKKLKKNFKNIHITVGYKGSMLANYVIKHNVSSVINTNNKDNAWWIFNFPFNFLNEPIIVLTCDNITNINFKKILRDYKHKRCPLCMLIPVVPIKGLEGDYIHSKKNKVYKLSRKKKSNYYCSGIQILNPYKINKAIKKTYNFNYLWKKLIKLKQLYVSDVKPEKWFTIDNLKQLKRYKKTIY